MTNILITACYKVENRVGMRHDVPFEFNNYRVIAELCLNSFRKNLEGIDEIIVLDGTFENYHRMFQDIYYRIQKLYKMSECNILFVDSDDLCIRPTTIFGEYDKFVMFDIQNQHCAYRSSRISGETYKHLKPWMMSNVRYYPAGAITEDMWKMGDELADNWVDVWAYECIIYNTLFHAQGLSESEIMSKIYNQNLNYQSIITQIDYSKVPRGVQIIHLHSARDMSRTIKTMRRLMEDMKI